MDRRCLTLSLDGFRHPCAGIGGGPIAPWRPRSKSLPFSLSLSLPLNEGGLPGNPTSPLGIRGLGGNPSLLSLRSRSPSDTKLELLVVLNLLDLLEPKSGGPPTDLEKALEVLFGSVGETIRS